ncbi:hypothetical protein ACIBO9_07825 [Streptomyces prunicolor]|uniref:hypothetical protein n=1 Tax=Streptomyces prunicolor TaxID=67348 RepID=UPI0037D1F811
MMKKTRSGLIAFTVVVTMGFALTPAVAFAAADHRGSAKTTTTHMTIAANQAKSITDASYNGLYKGGDAKEGVLALIKAGAVRINDTQVPTPTSSSTYSADRLDINGGNGLFENADGTWSWTAHITLHGENESYADAALGLVNAITTQKGLSYRLTLKNGVVTAIDESVYDAAFANTVTTGRKYTTITILGEGDGSTNKPNPSTVKFPNVNVTGHPQSQNMVKYWYDAEGWHLERAASREAIVDVDASSTATIPATINGEAITDSQISLQYSEAWNRPSQPIEAMTWLGENHVSVTQWFGSPGITIGFSRDANVKTALKSAISKAEHALDTAAVSAAGDGTDVAAGKMWVTQDYHDIFARAIKDAQAGYADRHATTDEYDGTLYRLAQAYGAPGGGYSKQDNTYFGDEYNGVGFWAFAQAHLGTRSGN